jgi:hypothetical protein
MSPLNVAMLLGTLALYGAVRWLRHAIDREPAPSDPVRRRRHRQLVRLWNSVQAVLSFCFAGLLTLVAGFAWGVWGSVIVFCTAGALLLWMAGSYVRAAHAGAVLDAVPTSGWGTRLSIILAIVSLVSIGALEVAGGALALSRGGLWWGVSLIGIGGLMIACGVRVWWVARREGAASAALLLQNAQRWAANRPQKGSPPG